MSMYLKYPIEVVLVNSVSELRRQAKKLLLALDVLGTRVRYEYGGQRMHLLVLLTCNWDHVDYWQSPCATASYKVFWPRWQTITCVAEFECCSRTKQCT